MNLPPQETRPEQYLREIRDLQIKNFELLEELVEQQQSEKKWKHLKMTGNIIIMILPYLLSAYLSWLFYLKIETMINNVYNAPKNAIESVTSIWNTKENIIEEGSIKTESIVESIKSYFTEE